jgi:hypothetical protein
MDKSPDKIVSFLRSKGYAYFILDSSCVSKYGLNKTNDFINTLTGVATVVGSNNGFILFKV